MNCMTFTPIKQNHSVKSLHSRGHIFWVKQYTGVVFLMLFCLNCGHDSSCLATAVMHNLQHTSGQIHVVAIRLA